MCIFELSLSLDENFSAIGLKCIFGLPPSWHGHLDYWRTVLLVAGTFPTSFWVTGGKSVKDMTEDFKTKAPKSRMLRSTGSPLLQSVPSGVLSVHY